MAYSNDFTALINKIERQLGLIPLTPHFPKEFNKEAWGDVIKQDSLVTFSRYYPYKIKYRVNQETTVKKGKRYFLKDEYIGNAKILGIGDIDWGDFGSDNASLSQVGPYGYYSQSYYGAFPATIDQTIGYQLGTDLASSYNTGIYIEYIDPNAFEVKGVGNLDFALNSFIINVYVEHNNLSTISPTKMETFERLAKSDVATFLYQNLKYYDGLETVYAQIDMKLGELQEEGNKRENIIETLENGYVSASNDAIPYMITVQ